MAMPTSTKGLLAIFILSTAAACSVVQGQLSTTFYDVSCPNLQSVVRSEMLKFVTQEARMGASILRLFFHDCFATGCDASILLDDNLPYFSSEKNAPPNALSVRGYEVIDAIKTSVEAACSATVSCADILALAARDAVELFGGPTWSVWLGRRDATTASQAAAVSDLPPATASLSELIIRFASEGLSAQDMTALLGAHTIGQARCSTFNARILGDANIDASYANYLKQICSTPVDTLVPLDVQTSNTFDNAYYQNLLAGKGLLHSDQELYNNGSQDLLSWIYSVNSTAFFGDFAAAMVKMGNINPLTGFSGEIRTNCRKVN